MGRAHSKSNCIIKSLRKYIKRVTTMRRKHGGRVKSYRFMKKGYKTPPVQATFYAADSGDSSCTPLHSSPLTPRTCVKPKQNSGGTPGSAICPSPGGTAGA